MAFLTEATKEIGITLEDLARKLGRDPEEIRSIAESGDSETQLEVWAHYVVAVNDEQSLIPQLHCFYSEFIPEQEKREAFITEALSQKGTNIPRRMVNSIEGLVTLADDMDRIRPGHECVKAFFIAVAIETLYKLTDRDWQTGRALGHFLRQLPI